MNDSPQCVLLVDDDEAVRTVLSAQLEQAGIESVEASSAEEALERLASGAIDVMVTDLRMPGTDGMALLAQSVKLWPDVPVIMLTAFGTVPVAVEAIKLGASDFLLKPFERRDVLEVVERALRMACRPNQPPPPPSGVASSMVGALEHLRADMLRAASGSASILIHGENGTGKELVARAIHDASPRAHKPFVAVNCAALPEQLIESELFGYEKGAFTGATKVKPGRVEVANGGTLFLDEIGDYPISIQVKLLRLLQSSEFERLGGTETRRADVRFIAATNKKLEQAVKRGEFREDLYFRFVIPIRVPPLRERPQDIRVLAPYFSARSADANGRRRVGIEAAAMALLMEQPWPGNVRQLENFVERLVVFTDGDAIRRADVEREMGRDAARSEGSASATSGLAERVREAERLSIVEALTRTENNRSKAARLIGLSRRSLYNKLKEHGLLQWHPAEEQLPPKRTQS
jgi:DNA-binding NtrC family response regulator